MSVAWVGAGIAAAGAVSSARAGSKAAKAQQASADQAAALEREQYEQTREDNAGFRRRGDQAGNRLQYLMGLDSSVGAPIAGGGTGPTFSGGMIEVPTTYVSGQTDDPLWEQLLGDFNARHTEQFGSGMNRDWSSDADAQREYALLSKAYKDAKSAEFEASQAANPTRVPADQDPNFGSLMRKFSKEDLEGDVVYNSGLEFGLNEGTKAINNRAGAGGAFLSGATLKALTRFGNDYGSTKAGEARNRFVSDQDSQYNRLAGISGTGQSATNQVSAAGAGYASRAGDYITQGGNAGAAGIIGGSNALVNGLNTGYNIYQDNQLMQKIRNPNPSGGWGSQGGWQGGGRVVPDYPGAEY